MKRTPLKRKTPLRSYSKLKRKTPLKAKTRLKPQSEKARAESKVWVEAKRQRMKALIAKFGYLPCEYCSREINHGAIPDGHHNDRNRRNNVFENCRILDRYHHGFIHDQNIKDVPSLL